MSKKQLSSRENKKIAKEVRSKNIVLTAHALEDVRNQTESEQQEIIFYEVMQPFRDRLQMKEQLRLSEEDEGIAQQGCAIQYS